MPTEEEAIDFLADHGCVRLGTGSAPTAAPDERIGRLDWDRFFRLADPEEPNVGHLDLPMIERSIGRGLDEGMAQEIGQAADWDKCAWYQPMHFFGYEWGIYVREECLIKWAEWIVRLVPGPPPSTPHERDQLLLDILRAAFLTYFLHEQFHHKVESLSFRFHVIARGCCYLPYKEHVYERTRDTADWLEEALANADSYHRLVQYRLPKNVRDATRRLLEMTFPFNPAGYKEAVHYLTARDFREGQNKLIGQVREAVVSPLQPTAEWNVSPDITRSLFRITSHIWTIVPPGRIPLLPHALSAPTCSTKDMIRLVRGFGWEIEPGGGKGSHVKLKKPGADPIVLPGDRKDLTPGAVRNALRALDRSLSISQLPDLLSGQLVPAG